MQNVRSIHWSGQRQRNRQISEKNWAREHVQFSNQVQSLSFDCWRTVSQLFPFAQNSREWTKSLIYHSTSDKRSLLLRRSDKWPQLAPSMSTNFTLNNNKNQINDAANRRQSQSLALLLLLRPNRLNVFLCVCVFSSLSCGFQTRRKPPLPLSTWPERKKIVYFVAVDMKPDAKVQCWRREKIETRLKRETSSRAGWNPLWILTFKLADLDTLWVPLLSKWIFAQECFQGWLVCFWGEQQRRSSSALFQHSFDSARYQSPIGKSSAISWSAADAKAFLPPKWAI